MSLFKQMALAISLIIVILLGAVMAINYQSSKQDMIQSLYETTVNNISSITSQLSEAGNSPALITSIIDAEFDSGYFKKIYFESNDGSFSYKQEDIDPVDGVPTWFVDFTSIKLDTVTSDVSSGWNMVGVVRVDADTGIVYKALYKMFVQLLYIFAISVSVSLITLSIMLSIILKPLKGVQRQAEAVIKNEFIIQKDVPYTKEFKDVVLGMNNMVSKVKAMFDKGNEELKRHKEFEYIDPTTKLRNRKYLIDKFPAYLKIDAHSKGGVNMMVALSGVVAANEKIGHQEVDKLFREIADIFRSEVSYYEESIIARMNGTEFSIFVPECNSKNAIAIAEAILKKSVLTILEYELDTKETFISIGLYEYNYQESIGRLLSQSDNALAQAKFNTTNIHLAQVGNITEVMGKDAWREIINNAIQKNMFKFVSWSAVDAKKKKVAHKVLSLTLQANADKIYYYGQFMAPANQAGLSGDIYRNVLKMLFKNSDNNFKNAVYSLRLPFEFLVLTSTYEEMKKLLNSYALRLPFKLIIEVPDKLVSQNNELVKDYKKLFEKNKIEMGIFEFIGESKDYKYLQELRPVYIKGESTYFLSQSDQSLSALRLITDSVGITLIASGVMDMDTLQELQERDIHTIQGKATELI
ncbi:MAG: LapD/MoxY N-terminal periplasmic domain-containing protein [Sulfurimonas sp.]